MIKKWLLVLLAWLSLAVHAYAVELNTATQAELEALKGIGPVKSKAIVDERTKNGPFKDADDFATRVKGIGDKTVVSLESQGLTINGSSTAPKGGAAAAATTAAPAASMSMKKTPGANVKSPSAGTAAAAASAPPATAAMSASASSADAASSASGKKSKKASKKAGASAASAASASK
jgi:competence protein ComEA